MALGTFWSDRVGGRRSVRAQRRRARRAAAPGSTAAIDRATADEATARHRAHPGPAALLLTATGPRPRLWERRRADDDALELRLGLGTVSSAVEVRNSGGLGGADAVERPVLVDVPVTVPLAEAGVLGLAGARSRVLPLARSLVAQLAGWHSPRHLDLVAAPAPSRRRDWEWARWLPHLRAGPDGGPLRVGVDGAQLRARVDELVAVLDARAALRSRRARTGRGPGRRPWSSSTAPARCGGSPGSRGCSTRDPTVGLRVLCLERDLVSLPVECRATAEVDRRGRHPAARRRARTPRRTTTWSPTGSATAGRTGSPGPSRRCATRPRTTSSPRCRRPPGCSTCCRSTRPTRPRWRPPGGSARAAPGSCSASARTASRSSSTSPPTARTPWSPAPPARASPSCCRRWSPGSPLANRPDEMSFVLVDYKGGAAFRDCARLPHTVGTVTDLDGHLTERALRSLGAELRRRETVLRSAGCKDLDDYLAHGAGRVAAAAAAGPGRRRVRHPGRGAARLRRRSGRHRPARPLARRPPGARDPTAGRCRQRRHPGEHQPADRAAGHRPGRVDRRRRRARRRGHPAGPTPAARCCGSGAGPVRAAAVGAGRRPPGRGRRRCRCGRRRGSGPATRRRRPATTAPPARPTWPGWSTPPGRRPPRIGAAPVASPWLPPLPRVVTVERAAGAVRRRRARSPWACWTFPASSAGTR